MSDVKTGGCLCGAVRYEFTGEPLFAGNCYCTDCQKYNGSGHQSAIGTLESNYKVTGPVSEYSMTGGSGNPIVRQFCSKCGSHVGSSAAGGIHIVYAGTLDDSSDYKPGHNIYCSQAQPWDQPSADIPGFPEAPPEG
jgi:hypothetical protein